MEFVFTTEDLQSSGLTSTQYTIGQAVATVCSKSPISVADANDVGVELNISSEYVLGYVAVRPDLYKVSGICIELTDESKKIFQVKFSSIAPQVIEIWNNVNKEKRRVAPYKAVIDGVCKADKSITLTSFESVIVHKAETWGRDENMEIYNRPETIFKSVRRFLVYLEDARVYWAKQHKRESYF